MIHPVFRLAASQPLLLAEHAAAYAGLVSEELVSRGTSLKRRVALQLAGAAGLLVAIMLAGVALLLWASLPDAGFRAPWLLWLVPALPAVLGGWALWLAQEPDTSEPFASLRSQLAQDAALLRTPLTP